MSISCQDCPGQLCCEGICCTDEDLNNALNTVQTAYGIGVGVIVAIVIGILAAIGGCIACCVCCCRRQRPSYVVSPNVHSTTLVQSGKSKVAETDQPMMTGPNPPPYEAKNTMI